MAFIMLRYVPSISSLLRVFIVKECCILPNAFWVSIEMIVIFIFHFVDVMYYIYSFAYVEPSLYPRDKSLFVMVYNIFNVVLYLVS